MLVSPLAIWLLEEGVKPLVVLRNTLYELMEQLAGAVSAVQLTLITLEEAAVPLTPLGADGAVEQDDPLPPLPAAALTE